MPGLNWGMFDMFALKMIETIKQLTNQIMFAALYSTKSSC